MTVSAISNFIAVLTILGQVLVIAGVVYYFATRKNRVGAIGKFLNKNGLPIAFLIALTATLGSLFYSELAKFTPCELCWFQRIFMYPQVLLLGVAAWRGDKNIARYSILLSVVGAVIAAYHYYLQLGGAAVASCAVVGYSVSCAEKFIMQFGYITIPLMALTAFLMIILAMVLQKNRQQ